MSLRLKLGIAFLVSTIVLVGGLFLFLERRPEEIPSPAAGEESGAVATPAQASRRVPARNASGASPVKPEARVALEKVGSSARVSPAGGGWVISGRIVRETALEAGGSTPPPEAGAAAADLSLVPAQGVTVHVKPHPRRTKPEEAPPPRKVLTGPDGRFEFTGVPARVYLRLEIDEPTSAFQTLGFRLPEPDADNRRELGDLAIEPGATLRVRLIGPQDEPVEKGKLLVNKSSSNPRRSAALSTLGFSESRRDMDEQGKGEYVLDRSPVGSVYIEATAPGYGPPGRETVELPREEPVVIRMLPGTRIAGVVLSAEGKPVEGAELETGGTSNPHKAKTDGSGRFVFDTLGQGDFDISLEAAGFVSVRKGGVPAGTEDLEFALTPEAVFAGKVVSVEDGKPVPKAKVTLRSADRSVSSLSAESDDRGSFLVRKIPAGTYNVTADHPEFAPSTSVEREIKEAERIAGQTIALPAGLVATGKVIDGETQAPIPEAQVSFQYRSQGPSRPTRRSEKTGPEGSFQVKGLEEGQYLMQGAAKGYLSGKGQPITISSGSSPGEREFTIKLEQGSSIAGRVVDSAGNPIAGAQVRPNISQSPSSFGGAPPDLDGSIQSIVNLTTQTDAEGRYRLEGLPSYPAYAVNASHRDFAPGLMKGIALGAKEAVEGADIQLFRGGTIRGRVLDENSRGIPGASVRARLEKAAGEENENYLVSTGGGSVTSDREGNYVIPRAPQGSYTVHAQLSGRMPASRSGVAVAEERDSEGIDLVMEVGETLAGQVVDSDGSPLSGVDIYVSTGDSAQGRTDSEGRFLLKGLKPGNGWINVNRSGFEHQNFQVTVPRDELLVTMVRAARIVGVVQAKGQEAFRGFQIIATAQVTGQGGGNNQRSYGNGQNDGTGRFEVQVGEGTYVLTAMVPGYAPSRSAPITVKKGERREGVVIDLLPGATIQGVVVAAGSGEAIEGASVTYQSSEEQMKNLWGMASARSDIEGSFTLEGVSEGTVNLIASHPRYAQAVLTGISTRAGDTARVRVELSAGGGIRGIVSYGGVPAAGARVHAWLNGGLTPFGKDGVTDSEGRFELKGLPAGDYLVSVMGGKGGNFRNRQNVLVIDGQFTDVDLAEKAGIRLSGRVLSGGAPLRGGDIQAHRPEGGWEGGHGEIDSSGSYSLEVPGPGTYYILVQSGNQGGSKMTVTIPEGGSEFTQDFELPSGQITGVAIEAETGAPLAQVQVVAFQAGTPSRSFVSLFRSMHSMGMSDDQGRFVLTSLPAGAYSVRAFAQGYAEGRVERVEVDEGGSRNVRIALDRGVVLQARVVDGKGQPLHQAAVHLRNQAGDLVNFIHPAFSDPAGMVEIQGVRPGLYRLTALHRSHAPSSVSVRAAADGEPVTVVLRPGGKVQVQVQNQKSRGIEGAEVEILDEKGENVLEESVLFGMGPMAMQSALTRTSGILVLDQVAPGAYRAAARKGQSRSGEEKLTVSEGQVSSLQLTINE